MSSTRRADPNAPLSQERYMSGPEFSDLQGINGLAVARRCALLASPAQRALVWFIQGLSLLHGGCKGLASELLRTFPERIGTRTMHKLGKGKGQRYTGKEAAEINGEMHSDDGDCTFALLNKPSINGRFDDSTGDVPEVEPGWGLPMPWEDVYESCLKAAKAKLPDFLTELCINPALEFRIPGETESEGSQVRVNYFRDIIGTLFDYKRLCEERAQAEFCQTAIARKIWAQLDDALRTGTMVVIDGLEGRGKTAAARAWCNCHLGVARFITLDGTTTKTGHFREFARALGLSHGVAWKAAQMEARVKDVLRSSGLMVVVDEAHFFFNQGPRMWTRPEMLDWIDTALCNPPLPVALVTTPQFMACIERAARHVGWNYRQFRRRSRYCRLPQKNSQEDIESVARRSLPGADKRTITLVLGYVALSKRDLSAVGDVAREARLIAEQEGATKVVFDHVNRAIQEVLVPGDTPWAEMEQRLRNGAGARRQQPTAPAPGAPEAATARPDPEPVAQIGSANRPGRGVAPGPARGRFLEPEAALVCDTD